MPNLSNEDIIIAFNDEIYPICIDDASTNNIEYIINIIKEISDEEVSIDDLIQYDIYDIIDYLYNFKDNRNIIFGTVISNEYGKGLFLDSQINGHLKNTFNQLKDNLSANGFKYIKLNGKYIELENNINEVSDKDISLNSFKVKSELHPKIWIDNRINSRVRLKLLDIADDFINELSVTWVKPKDIVFTGSLANYNWSRYSDIDVHIIYDFKKVYKNNEFVEDYFKSKKENWKQQHDSIKIYGFPVEISIEDYNDEGVSSGVYSLNKNKWIKEPTDFDDVKLNEKYIKSKASKIMSEIDDIENKLKTEEDNYKIEKLGKKLKSIFNRLKKSRSEALERSGEMSSMNIVYKICRRTKYIDKLWDMINNTYNKINSIK